MDLYYDQLSYESYTLPYLTSHINFYLISKLPYFLVICALLKFFHLASLPHLASWKRGGPCSVTPATSRCPGRTKHAWNQTPSFRKFNQQNTWKITKVSSPTRKTLSFARSSEFWVPSHVSSVEPCRTLVFSSPSVFSDSLSIPWKFHPLYFLLFLSLPLSTRCKIWFFWVLHRLLRWHEA